MTRHTHAALEQAADRFPQLADHLKPAALQGPPPRPGQAAVVASDVPASQQTRALRRLVASVASRRTCPGPDAPADGALRLRHGDYEVLALALDTTRRDCSSWQPKPAPAPVGHPVCLFLAP